MSYCDEAQTQAHHWVLEGASGPTSRGICIHCKVEKEHFNYVHGLDWGLSPDTSRNREEQRQQQAAREVVYPDGTEEQL